MNSENQMPFEHDHHDHGPGHRNDHGCKRRWGRRMFWKAPLILVFIALKGVVVMYLWNYLVPEIFHGPELNYLQAIGLMILSKLLLGFGGFGHFRRGHHHMHHRHHRHMGRHFWKNMSEEERNKLREKLRGQSRPEEK